MFRFIMYDENGLIMYKSSWQPLNKKLADFKAFIKGYEENIELEYKNAK